MTLEQKYYSSSKKERVFLSISVLIHSAAPCRAQITRCCVLLACLSPLARSWWWRAATTDTPHGLYLTEWKMKKLLLAVLARRA